MSLSTKDLIKAAASAKLKALQLNLCFDPNYPESRPTEAQAEFFKDASRIKFRYLIGGNGCLVEGTLVSTPKGPVPIEQIKVGDEVYSEDGIPIKVLKTFNNGRKEVVEITNRGRVWAESTDVHVWQVITPGGTVVEKQISEFNRDDTIVRKELTPQLGNKTVPYAYALGALLGDGCSKQPGNRVLISGMYESLISKVADQLSGTYKKQGGGNYTWAIKAEKPELYQKWCEGRKAHEKIVDLAEIKQWDRQTLLQFVAGVLDADGSVYLKRKSACINIGMQAKSVIDALEYAFLALWQTPVSRDIDNRDKYVHGPVYSLCLCSNAFTLRIIKELDKYTVVESKKWKAEYADFESKRSTADRVGYLLKQRRIAQVYDIHVDSPTNLYCLANGLVTHNSGKCLQAGTLVATPQGPVSIEDLKVGDMVYSEQGQPIRVKNVWYQGKQEVYPIVRAKRQIASATANHKWQLEDGSQVRTDGLSGQKINRVRVKAPLGSVDQPAAYALGALLGDGCGMSASKNPHLSSEDHEIPSKVALSLGCEYKKLVGNNDTWELVHNSKDMWIPHDSAWAKTYAHLKVVDLDVIKTWNRASVLNFLAGLIDTDGSVYYKNGKIRIVQFGCQSRNVVKAVQWCLLALFNVQTTILVDSRSKYINGPVYEIKVTDQLDTDAVLKELGPLLILRKNIPQIDRQVIRVNRFNVHLRTDRVQVVDTYDIEVDSDTHLFLLANGYVTHNSQVGGRELAWIIEDKHPYWDMPEDWKTRPLQCLVVGKSRSIVENELWTKKIKQFFGPDEWKEVRGGNVLQSVEHRVHKHKIIFLSHSDGSQRAIDNLQAYDADIVWVDEMPAKQAVLEETQRRARRPNTLWFATFTPKSINVKIRKQVDAAKEPTSKRYRMSRLDVPGVDREAELAGLAGLTNAQKRTILEGEWSVGDEHVYSLDADTMITPMPADYSKNWRHVESVDPGSNRGGLTVWAEHPKTKIWYCIKAEYIDGLRDPVAFYDYTQTATGSYNIMRRICDPASTSHLGHAAARKCSPPYIVPYAKNQGRKEELIKNFQKLLSSGKLKIVDEYCPDLVDELANMQRKENEKIINSHAYHLADTCNYFADLIPEPTEDVSSMSRDEWILRQDDKRRAAESKEYDRQNKKQSKEQVHKILMNLHRGKRWR